MRRHGWSDDYIEDVRTIAVGALERLGDRLGTGHGQGLGRHGGPVDAADAADVIQKYASELEADVRRLADSQAPFHLSVEHVDLDAYWAYWLDGAGHNVRMRINARNASFTEVQARQFALHEVLGHGLQCASYAQQCQEHDVPWVRLTSVHAQQQVLLEASPRPCRYSYDRLISHSSRGCDSRTTPSSSVPSSTSPSTPERPSPTAWRSPEHPPRSGAMR